MLKKISHLFISIGVIGFLVLIIINIKQIQTNKVIISNIEYDSTYGQYYLGYIEIDILNIRVPLVYGTSSKELNQNVVGINNHSTNNHIILAGHAVSSVFLPLYKIELDTKVTIRINKNKYNYIVDYIKVVDKKDISIYNNEGLTLITCVSNDTRFIVHAKTAD